MTRFDLAEVRDFTAEISTRWNSTPRSSGCGGRRVPELIPGRCGRGNAAGTRKADAMTWKGRMSFGRPWATWTGC